MTWKRRAIVGCEMGGEIGHRLAQLGWQVITADLLPSLKPDMDYRDVRSVLSDSAEGMHGSVRHYQGDVRDLFSWEHPWNVRRRQILEMAGVLKIPEEVPLFELGIFHPPCTHLTLGGARYWKEKRATPADWRPAGWPEDQVFSVQDDAAYFFMEMVNAPVQYCAVENPRGDMTRRYRAPDQYTQPWWFGDDLIKATGWWLRGLPPLVPDRPVEARVRVTTGGGSHRTDMKRDGKSNNSWEDSRGRRFRHIMRSLTPPGVARAVAEQWTAFIAGDQMRSYCCGAPMTVSGRTTRWYVCTRCKQPCDVAT